MKDWQVLTVSAVLIAGFLWLALNAMSQVGAG